jgi:hypothetical protein
LLVVVLPKPNFVPTNTYQAKKLLNLVTMGVERIHACPNHHILYRGVFKEQPVVLVDTKGTTIVVKKTHTQ